MDQFVIFTDPMQAREEAEGLSIARALAEVGQLLPDEHNPVTIIREEICIVYEPARNGRYTNPTLTRAQGDIDQFYRKGFDLIVMLHGGSSSRIHDRQGQLFPDSPNVWRPFHFYHHCPNDDSYKGMCRAIGCPTGMTALRSAFDSPATIAEEIKIRADKTGEILPEQADVLWNRLMKVLGDWTLFGEFKNLQRAGQLTLQHLSQKLNRAVRTDGP